MVSPFSSEIAQDVTRNGRQVLAAAEKELAEGVEEVRVKEEQVAVSPPSCFVAIVAVQGSCSDAAHATPTRNGCC